jgi:hypothetical protein
MADAATLKSLKLGDVVVTPSDQWVLPMRSFERVSSPNIGAPPSREVRPTVAIASGPIRKLTNRKDMADILNTTGWELVAELYDGTTYIMKDCAIEGNPNLETDGGVIPLEVSGQPEQL